METKQVKFQDADGEIFGGILVDTGSESFVICGCCGGVFWMDEEGTEWKLIETYDEWVNISEEIRYGK